MISHRSISRFSGRVGLLNQASRIFNSRSESPSQISQTYNVSPGSNSYIFQAPTLVNAAPKLMGSLGMKFGYLKVNDNASPPSSLNFRSGIHSACPKEFEREGNTRSMDLVRGGIQENGRNTFRGFQQQNGRDTVRGFQQQNGRDTFRGFQQQSGRYSFRGSQFPEHVVERDPDIVHIKLIRNNAFVTVTDCKGNKKIGASSGCLKTKESRYAAESTAEHVGRLAKNMGLKSFVVKVNGFTYFKKKKQAILSFRDGYTNSRSDQNPIVYIEDTTRRAHNGCRLRKKRRV